MTFKAECPYRSVAKYGKLWTFGIIYLKKPNFGRCKCPLLMNGEANLPTVPVTLKRHIH